MLEKTSHLFPMWPDRTLFTGMPQTKRVMSSPGPSVAFAPQTQLPPASSHLRLASTPPEARPRPRSSRLQRGRPAGRVYTATIQDL